MAKVTTLAEFQYRKGEQQLDRCRRIAQAMLDREENEAKKMLGDIALQGWLDAGNGRKDDGPGAA